MTKDENEPTAAEVLAFLHGAGSLEGVWFGDRPQRARGNFWWRKYLPALAASPPKVDPMYGHTWQEQERVRILGDAHTSVESALANLVGCYGRRSIADSSLLPPDEQEAEIAEGMRALAASPPKVESGAFDCDRPLITLPGLQRDAPECIYITMEDGDGPTLQYVPVGNNR